MNKKKLWHFYWDCGYGEIACLFIATEEDIKNLIGKRVYFGEALGKYREIYGVIKIDDIKVVNVSDEVVIALEQALGTTLTGYNPFDYLEDEENEEKEDESIQLSMFNINEKLK